MAASRVPWSFRSKALLRCSLREQSQLLAQARRSALFSLQAGGLAVCWAALVALLSVLLWSIRGSTLFWLILVATAIMGVQMRVLLVRVRLQELLLEQIRAAPSSET